MVRCHSVNTGSVVCTLKPHELSALAGGGDAKTLETNNCTWVRVLVLKSHHSGFRVYAVPRTPRLQGYFFTCTNNWAIQKV